jgi:hypothetical protein
MLPSVKKTLSSAMTKLERVKKVIVGVAIATVVAAGSLSIPTDAQAAPSSQFTAATPVMLVAVPGGNVVGYHSSHASHASHDSHASHASHASSRY